MNKYTSPHLTKASKLKLLVLLFILVFFFPSISYGQNCQNATHVQAQKAFYFNETNAESFALIVPNKEKITLGVTWRNGTSLPNQWSLYSGNCSTLNLLAQGSLAAPEDNIFYFSFDSLTIGQTYYFKFSGAGGTRYVLEGYLTESIQPAGTCISGNCNLVQNPGFEQAALNRNTTNPVGGVITTNPLAAFADQACGWDLPIAFGNTPDYLLSPLHASYANPQNSGCTTQTAIGNACPGFAHNSSGVLHLFSIDNRPNQNRREYVITTLNQDVENGGIYYVGLTARPNMNRQTRSSALQALIVDDNTVANNPLSNNQPITQWGTPQVDFSAQIDNTSGAWQTVGTIFQHNNTNGDNLVIGNFLDNTATQPFLDFNQPPGNTVNDIPSLWVDDVEVIRLPDAGTDQTVCNSSLVQPLGNPYCLSYPTGLQTTWYNAVNQVVGNSVPFTPNISQSGVYDFRLELTYNGQTFNDYVTVTVAPEVTVDALVDTDCDNATYLLNNFLQGSTITNVSSTNVNFITYNFDPNTGILEIVQPDVTASNGIGIVTISGNLSFNGILCPFTLNVFTYKCCTNASQVDYFFPQNTTMSTQLAALGTSIISNFNFVIAGDVIVDADYTFNNCTFYLMPDARLIIDNSRYVTAFSCTFQPCGDYRWDEIFVSNDAYFIVNESFFTGAIRGIHVVDNAALDAFDNTFDNNYNSILLDNFTNSPFIEIYANTFVCEEIGHNGIEQAPGSTVPFANPQHDYVTAIALVNSSTVTIGNNTQSANLFTTTNPTNPTLNSELSYINIYQSNDIDVVNNHFGAAHAAVWAYQSTFNVGGSPANENIFWPAQYSPGASLDVSNAILASFSSALVAHNDFNGLHTAIDFQKCGLQSEGYGITTITENTISNTSFPVQFYNPVSTGSRVRINNNTISAEVRGVFIKDFTQCDTPDRVFINSNDVYVSTPTFGNYRKAIELENTHCATIGNNNLGISGLYWPTGASNVIGLHILNSEGNRASNNTYASIDFGLVMENDNGSTRYSCESFNTCYTSILYKNITATNVQPVRNFNPAPGSGNTASGNVFINNLNPAGRTDADVFTLLNTGGPVDYDYDGISGGSQDPKISFNASSILDKKTKLVGICGTLPSSKNEVNSSFKSLSFEIYPNPSNTGMLYFRATKSFDRGTISILNANGVQIENIILLGQEEQVFHLSATPGLYILIVEIDGKTSYEKLVLTNN